MIQRNRGLKFKKPKALTSTRSSNSSESGICTSFNVFFIFVVSSILGFLIYKRPKSRPITLVAEPLVSASKMSLTQQKLSSHSSLERYDISRTCNFPPDFDYMVHKGMDKACDVAITKCGENRDPLRAEEFENGYVLCVDCYWPVPMHTVIDTFLKFAKQPFILKTRGYSWAEIPKWKEYLKNPLIHKWVAIHPPLIHEKLIPMPVGIRYDHGRLISETLRQDRTEPQFRVLSSFRDRNEERHRVIEYANSTWSDFSDIRYSFKSNESFSRFGSIATYLLFSNYTFVLSPRGVGIDCHRTWEAIYLNSIPVVETDYRLNPMYEGLPIVIVENWDTLTFDEIVEKYNKLTCTNRDYLTTEWWKSMLKEERGKLIRYLIDTPWNV